MAETYGASTLRVNGLTELVRAFDTLQGKTKSEVRDALVVAGEPVRSAAEHYAASEIRNVADGDPWAKMRLGITPRMVYVAPAQRSRRKGNHRPKFGTLLLEKAMWPSAIRHEHEVLDGLEKAIDHLSREEGF